MNRLPIHITLLSWVLIMLLGWSCAQIGMPSGGDKDELPPSLLLDQSTANKQTHFEKQNLVFTFDEWVRVDNPSKEVFVSPPLAYPPQVSVRGKEVLFEFSENELLKENTTYQINFGKAIKDLTEGNVYEPFVFLFSTGDVIDSLLLRGQVVDAVTKQGQADVLVMLYDNLADSCFTTIKPLYLTRTDSEGKYALENLRADTFQLYALADENVSYTYDVQTERIAFYDSLVYLQDTLGGDILLKMFDERDEPIMIEAKQARSGLIYAIFTGDFSKVQLSLLGSDSLSIYRETNMDTLKLWHDYPEADSLMLVIDYDAEIDTVKVRKGRKSMVDNKLRLLTGNIRLEQGDSLWLEWNKPLAQVDTTLITVMDTAQSVSIDSVMMVGRELYLDVPFPAPGQYTMILDSLSVTDWYGQKVQDSLTLSITVDEKTELGKIVVTVVPSDSLSYFVELMQNDEVLKKEERVEQKEELVYADLRSGQYKLQVTEDRNGDGLWTSGSLAERRLPEKVKELTLENLKSGWDLEVTLNLEELMHGTEGN